MSKNIKNTQKTNNIITIIVCVLVAIFASLAIFLSGFDWHNESILGNAPGGNNVAGLSGTVPLSDKKADFDEYFEDTVFVGDSITYGVAMYGYTSFNHVFAKVGLSQNTALYTRCVYTSKTVSYTIENALKMAKPGKVILTIGINAINSYKSDAFYSDYRKLIGKIKSATPDSVIIVQSILPVTANWAANNGKSNCNQYIIHANQKLYELAKEEGCYFLHTFEDLCDEQGFLLKKYSGDGIHLNRSGYEKMFDHILSRPVKSSGEFTKIGAITPPVIYNPNSSNVSMPDLNTQSSVAGIESSVSSNESSVVGDESSNISADTSDVSTSSSENESDVQSDLSQGDESDTSLPDENPQVSTSSGGQQDDNKPSQNKPNQNSQNQNGFKDTSSKKKPN